MRLVVLLGDRLGEGAMLALAVADRESQIRVYTPDGSERLMTPQQLLDTSLELANVPASTLGCVVRRDAARLRRAVPDSKFIAMVTAWRHRTLLPLALPHRTSPLAPPPPSLLRSLQQWRRRRRRRRSTTRPRCRWCTSRPCGTASCRRSVPLSRHSPSPLPPLFRRAPPPPA